MSTLSLHSPASVGTHPKGFWRDELVETIRAVVAEMPGARAADVAAAALARNPALAELKSAPFGDHNLEEEVNRVMWTLTPVDVALKRSIDMMRGKTDMTPAELFDFIKLNALKTKHVRLHTALTNLAWMGLEQLSSMSADELERAAAHRAPPKPAPPKPPVATSDPAAPFLHHLMRGYPRLSGQEAGMISEQASAAALARVRTHARGVEESPAAPSSAPIPWQKTPAAPRSAPIPWQENPRLARLVSDLVESGIQKNRMAWAVNVAPLYGEDVPGLLAGATADQLNRAVNRLQARRGVA